ncbi:hypothetical protein V6N13_007795 [Hibiscus sabdariffa]
MRPELAASKLSAGRRSPKRERARIISGEDSYGAGAGRGEVGAIYVDLDRADGRRSPMRGGGGGGRSGRGGRRNGRKGRSIVTTEGDSISHEQRERAQGMFMYPSITSPPKARKDVEEQGQGVPGEGGSGRSQPIQGRCLGGCKEMVLEAGLSKGQ